MINDDSDNKPVDCGTNTPVSEGMKRVKKKKNLDNMQNCNKK